MTAVSHVMVPIDHNGRIAVDPTREEVVSDSLFPGSAPVAVRLDQGIPGLSEATSWTMSPLESGDADPPTFFELTDEAASLTLVVADPWMFFGDYAPDLPDSELESLDIRQATDAAVFCPVTLDGAEDCIYLNLLGPLVFHVGTGNGRQLVLGDQDWPVRARVDLPA